MQTSHNNLNALMIKRSRPGGAIRSRDSRGNYRDGLDKDKAQAEIFWKGHEARRAEIEADFLELLKRALKVDKSVSFKAGGTKRIDPDWLPKLSAFRLFVEQQGYSIGQFVLDQKTRLVTAVIDDSGVTTYNLRERGYAQRSNRPASPKTIRRILKQTT